MIILKFSRINRLFKQYFGFFQYLDWQFIFGWKIKTVLGRVTYNVYLTGNWVTLKIIELTFALTSTVNR